MLKVIRSSCNTTYPPIGFFVDNCDRFDRYPFSPRYPALAEIFGFEIESAQRFCREVSELFHYALQQKKITTLAVPAKKKDQAECSGKAVIEIQTDIPLDQAER